MQVDPLSYGEEKHRGFRKTYKRIQPLVRILLHNPNLKPYIFPFLQQIDDWGELFIPDELSEAVNSRKNLSKILNKSYVKSYSKTLEETLEILETFEPLGSTKEEDEFLRLLGKMDTDQFLWWERCIALQIIFAWNEESRLPNLMKKPYKIAHGDLPVYGSNEDALYNAIITLRKSRKQRSSFFIEPNIYASWQLYTNREGQEFIGVGEFWKSGKKLSKIHEKDKQQDISQLLFYEGLRQQLIARKGLICPFNQGNDRCQCTRERRNALERLYQRAKDDLFEGGELPDWKPPSCHYSSLSSVLCK